MVGARKKLCEEEIEMKYFNLQQNKENSMRLLLF
jgi:hypothetical protein